MSSTRVRSPIAQASDGPSEDVLGTLQSETRQRETKSRSDGGASKSSEDLVLLVSSGAGLQTYALAPSSSYVLGRLPPADLLLPDDSVSRRHARLVVDGGVTIEDLGSTNGTRIHGVRMPSHERIALPLGSTFELGSMTCVLQRASALLGQGRSPNPGATVAPPSDGSTATEAVVVPPSPVPSPAALLGRDAPAVPTAPSIPPSPPSPYGGLPAHIVVRDPAMTRLYGLLDAIGPSGLSVLVLGETGTGKEVFASEVHRRSPRATKPFVQLNCAAISESLLESELFGHERGAFTGADRQKEGLFESADGGTVFLDELGELTLATQAKLLRFLESGEVMRLGSTRARKVDVRIVSATNRDLRGRIAEGAFRADLFFRINGMTVTLPPLRKRGPEVRPLFEFFVARKAKELGRAVPTLTDEAVTMLVGYAWPGNVRELRNVAERALVMCTKGRIEREHIFLGDDGIQESRRDPATADRHASGHGPASDRTLSPETTLPGMRAADLWTETSSIEHLAAEDLSESGDSLKAKLERVERQSILDALAKAGGNQTRAAGMLGLTRFALMRRLEALGIARPRKETR